MNLTEKKVAVIGLGYVGLPLAALCAKKGYPVLGLDAKEGERWKKAVAPIIEDYKANMNKKGFKGDELVDFTIKTLNDLQ